MILKFNIFFPVYLHCYCIMFIHTSLRLKEIVFCYANWNVQTIFSDQNHITTATDLICYWYSCWDEYKLWNNTNSFSLHGAPLSHFQLIFGLKNNKKTNKQLFTHLCFSWFLSKHLPGEISFLPLLLSNSISPIFRFSQLDLMKDKLWVCSLCGLENPLWGEGRPSWIRIVWCKFY